MTLRTVQSTTIGTGPSPDEPAKKEMTKLGTAQVSIRSGDQSGKQTTSSSVLSRTRSATTAGRLRQQGGQSVSTTAFGDTSLADQSPSVTNANLPAGATKQTDVSTPATDEANHTRSTHEETQQSLARTHAIPTIAVGESVESSPSVEQIAGQASDTGQSVDEATTQSQPMPLRATKLSQSMAPKESPSIGDTSTAPPEATDTSPSRASGESTDRSVSAAPTMLHPHERERGSRLEIGQSSGIADRASTTEPKRQRHGGETGQSSGVHPNERQRGVKASTPADIHPSEQRRRNRSEQSGRVEQEASHDSRPSRSERNGARQQDNWNGQHPQTDRPGTAEPDLAQLLASDATVDRVVGKLYRELEKKMRIERQRRGL